MRKDKRKPINDNAKPVTTVCLYCRREVRRSSMPTRVSEASVRQATPTMPVSHVTCGVCWLALAPTEDEYLARIVDLYELHAKSVTGQ